MSRYKITGTIYAQLGMNEWVKCYTWEFPHKHSVFTVWDKHMPYIEGERRILKRSRANNMCPVETQVGGGGGGGCNGWLLENHYFLIFFLPGPPFPKKLAGDFIMLTIFLLILLTPCPPLCALPMTNRCQRKSLSLRKETHMSNYDW